MTKIGHARLQVAIATWTERVETVIRDWLAESPGAEVTVVLATTRGREVRLGTTTTDG